MLPSAHEVGCRVEKTKAQVTATQWQSAGQWHGEHTSCALQTPARPLCLYLNTPSPLDGAELPEFQLLWNSLRVNACTPIYACPKQKQKKHKK